MISFLKLIRYKNLLMVLLTMVLTKYALLESFLEKTYLSHFDFIILVLSVIFITAGGYIINDIYDTETDKINKPHKLFIDHKISKKNAYLGYYTSTCVGLILGIYISFSKNLPYHSFYFVFTVILLFLYSKTIKQKLFIGNILVAFLCGLVIYLTYSFDFRINKKLFTNNSNIHSIHNLQYGIFFVKFYVFFSFITTLIREIIKDIEDIDGDLKIKAKTLPIIIGRERASRVAFVFSALLFIFFIIILQFLKNNYLFLGYGILLLILPQIYFMSKLWMAKSKKDFSKLSSFLKTIMLFGILSMLLFKFQ